MLMPFKFVYATLNTKWVFEIICATNVLNIIYYEIRRVLNDHNTLIQSWIFNDIYIYIFKLNFVIVNNMSFNRHQDAFMWPPKHFSDTRLRSHEYIVAHLVALLIYNITFMPSMRHSISGLGSSLGSDFGWQPTVMRSTASYTSRTPLMSGGLSLSPAYKRENSFLHSVLLFSREVIIDSLSAN